MLNGWLVVDKFGNEFIFECEPFRSPCDAEDPDDKFEWAFGCWNYGDSRGYIELPKGSIERLIGRSLTFEDEPVELLELE